MISKNDSDALELSDEPVDGSENLRRHMSKEILVATPDCTNNQPGTLSNTLKGEIPDELEHSSMIDYDPSIRHVENFELEKEPTVIWNFDGPNENLSDADLTEIEDDVTVIENESFEIEVSEVMVTRPSIHLTVDWM